MSAWHTQLCYGVYGGRSKVDNQKFSEAYAAFTRMDAEAVPYLAEKLHYLRSQRLEQAFYWAKKRQWLRPILKNMIAPTEQRCYAAVALRLIGPAAEAAIPALLESWKNDNGQVKPNCVAAMASILNLTMPDGLSLAEGRVFERRTVGEAARRFPMAAQNLGISLTGNAAPNAAANQSQPVTSGTSLPSPAAGSGR